MLEQIGQITIEGTLTNWSTRPGESRGTRHSTLLCGGWCLTGSHARQGHDEVSVMTWKRYPWLHSVQELEMLIDASDQAERGRWVVLPAVRFARPLA